MALVLILWAIAAVGAAEELRITLYDESNFNRHIIDEATDQLRRIFRHARIETTLTTGDPDEAEARLIVYTDRPRPDQLTRLKCSARRDIALNIVGAPVGVGARVLGMAFPFSKKGLNARVFSDRVALAALRENLPVANVLSHAIAHEIGHVLLRNDAHAENGLMASLWSTREYDQMKLLTVMYFTGEQATRMRDTLGAVGCEEITRAGAGARTPALNEVAMLNGRALAHTERGDYASAEAMYREVLRIQESVLGPDNVEVARALTTFAEVLYRQARYRDAEPLCRRVLAIRERSLGDADPDVAYSLNNLAEVYRATSRYVAADPLYRRALRDSRVSLRRRACKCLRNAEQSCSPVHGPGSL
jgi:hypothetical protein